LICSKIFCLRISKREDAIAAVGSRSGTEVVDRSRDMATRTCVDFRGPCLPIGSSASLLWPLHQPQHLPNIRRLMNHNTLPFT
jgi:hypothetical protein